MLRVPDHHGHDKVQRYYGLYAVDSEAEESFFNS
jgi:hypothetical protein